LLLEKIRDCKYIVTLEENVLAGGFGSAVLEMMTENALFDKKVRCIGIPDEFVTQGSVDILKEQLDLDEEGILEQIKQDLGC
ncbi:transketolase C-terminal domain-containing protein, partial [Acinetobacter radioresistens]